MAIDTWQRRLLVLAVPATTLAVMPTAMDSVGLPKLMVGSAIAVLLLAFSALRFFDHRAAAVLPVGPPAWATLAFIAAILVATAVAGFQGSSVIGQYGRYSGLLLYLSAALIFLHLVVLRDLRLLHRVAGAITVTGGIVAGMGLLQGAGVSVLGLRSLTSPLVGTLGNPNFFSAFLGVVTPFAIAGALDRRAGTPVRAGSALVVVAALAAATWSRSFQGLLAAGLGSAVLFLFLLYGREERRARISQIALAVVSALGVGLVALGLAGAGPVASIVGSRAVQFRVWYWEAALGMFRDHPVLGVGMDQYGGYFRRYRPTEAFQEAGVADAVDAAHNVPLSMFANGGVLLGLAYMSVLVVVAWTAVIGLRRADDRVRPLLGAFAGGWAAYQVQSLLSIDVPSLAYVHWVVAGGVAGLASPWRTFAVAGAPAGGRSSKRRSQSRRRGVPDPVATSVVAALVIATVWGLSRPLRADAAAAGAPQLAAEGQAEEAVKRLERAVELAPWQSTYHAALGEAQLRTGDEEQGLQAFINALAAEPRDLPYTVTAARLSAAADQPGRAAELYERAVSLEPNSAQLAVEAGEFFLLDMDDPDRARRFVEHALEVSPEHEAAQELARRIESEDNS